MISVGGFQKRNDGREEEKEGARRKGLVHFDTNESFLLKETVCDINRVFFPLCFHLPPPSPPTHSLYSG